MSEEAKTPEEIADALVTNTPYIGGGSLYAGAIDQHALRELIAQAVRDAYEQAARVAESIGWQEHLKAHDPQEDNSEDTGDLTAAAIRALKGE